MDDAVPVSAEAEAQRKRKNFTDDDDILLLKQVIADEPYRPSPGDKVMEKWNKVDEVLLSCPAFTRDNLAGKPAQNRVTLLLGGECRREKAKKKELKADHATVAEAARDTIRKLAVERLKRRSSDDSASPDKGTKLAKIVDLLTECKEKELAAKKEQRDAERRDRLQLERERLELEWVHQGETQRLLEVLAHLVQK